MKYAGIGICVAAVVLAGIAKAEYAGGDGSAATPYQISTVEHWQTLMNSPDHWDKHFVLKANLDLEGVQLTPVGNSSTRFLGVFDGGRFVISNAVIDMPGSDNVGLFGCVGYYESDDGHILNLGVENISVRGRTYVGGVVGTLDSGMISASYATGNVSGSSCVGGLCGSMWSGRMSGCYASADVQANMCAGGLVGAGGSIINSYAAGSVSAAEVVGGLIGEYGNVTACYAVARLTGERGVGGLFGNGMVPGTATNSFWDVETCETTLNYSGGVGLPTVAMLDAEMYLRAFWDFVGEIKNGTEDVWYMPPEGGYPILAWQVSDQVKLPNDEMAGATVVEDGASVSGSTIGATGLDITRSGYNDCLDVWYAFECAAAGEYTITLQSADFNAILAVFDGSQREIRSSEESAGGRSQVALNAKAGRRYYIRVAGEDGEAGSFNLKIK